MKKSSKHYEFDYKRQIVGEYMSGKISAEDLAQREGLERGQIYKWRVQLDQRQREERIETIAQTEGVSIDQARQGSRARDQAGSVVMRQTPNNPLVPTRTGEAPVLAAQRRRWAF